MVRPPSTGRHRIEIKYITDRSKRQVTFSKRRPTLFEGCSDLSLEFGGVPVAAVVFSEAGNAFAIGCPSVDAAVLGDGIDAHELEALKELRETWEATAKKVKAEVERMMTIGDRVVEARGEKWFWWEADPNELGAAELPEFTRALQRLKDNVRRHADKLAHRRPTAPAPTAAAVAHVGF